MVPVKLMNQKLTDLLHPFVLAINKKNEICLSVGPILMKSLIFDANQ